MQDYLAAAPCAAVAFFCFNSQLSTILRIFVGKKLMNSMTYLLELEVTNQQPSFVEDFFKSVAFVKTVKRIPDRTVKKPKPREHWAGAAQQMHLSGKDNLLLPDVFTDEQLDWWTWED
jgi:hypothetical protein